MLVRGIIGAVTLVCAIVAVPASADMRITEWMYGGGGGEFIEFTNVGTSPINMSGWSYDDDSRLAGEFSLSALGLVAPGESVVITEISAAAFRSEWNLAPSVKVLGGYANNLGRNDEINLFNGATLVDRLTFGDQNFAGTIRTQERSGNPISLAALGANAPAQWKLSSNGDVYGSYIGDLDAIANPGVFTLYVVPEPSSMMLLGIGVVASLAWFRRK